MSETAVLSSICEYLAYKRHFFWRSNNTPVYDSGRQAFRAMPKYAMKGVPDIIVIHQGEFIGLEVKQANGRLSPDQVRFRELCTENGAQYHVVRSIDDVRELGL